jgi:hypothetical protein
MNQFFLIVHPGFVAIDGMKDEVVILPFGPAEIPPVPSGSRARVGLCESVSNNVNLKGTEE